MSKTRDKLYSSTHTRQVWIPVECVPTASVAVAGGVPLRPHTLRPPPIHTHPCPSGYWDTHTPAQMHAGIHPLPKCMLGYTPKSMLGYTHPCPNACWYTPLAQMHAGIHPKVHAGIHTPILKSMLGYTPSPLTE